MYNINMYILPYVKEKTSPSLMMKQGTESQYTGTTQRDGMGREVGAFRMGDTCTPVADSCQLWQKPSQYCKVISLQLK